MSKEVTPVYDYSNNTFVVAVRGTNLFNGVRERIQYLQTKVTNLTTQIENEVPSRDSAIILLVTCFDPLAANPKAKYVLGLAEEIAKTQQELRFLSQFNKTVDPDGFYKLNQDQLERFGL